MLKLNRNNHFDQKILKCVSFRCSPAKISATNTPYSQIYIKIPRKGSVISLLICYLIWIFEVIKKTEISRYANGNAIRSVSRGLVVFFIYFKRTTSIGKYLEDISHAHIISLLYKLITIAMDTDELFTRLDPDGRRRQQEITNYKNVTGKNHLTILLKGVFGFAGHQWKATAGLGYKLTLTRLKDDAVSYKTEAVADARNKIDHIHWYVPDHKPSIQQRGVLAKQTSGKTPTELRYIERSVFMKEVKNQNHWTFDLGSQQEMNVPSSKR